MVAAPVRTLHRGHVPAYLEPQGSLLVSCVLEEAEAHLTQLEGLLAEDQSRCGHYSQTLKWPARGALCLALLFEEITTYQVTEKKQWRRGGGGGRPVTYLLVICEFHSLQ